MVDFEGGSPFLSELVAEMGGERYHVLAPAEANDIAGARTWEARMVPVQDAEREPEVPLPIRSFHEGGGFSYAGMPNVYERANGWDLSAPGRATTWAMHAEGESFTTDVNYRGWAVFFGTRLYILRGRYAYWYNINTSAGVDWVATQSTDFGAGNVVVGRPAEFKGKLYVPIADSATGADQRAWELTTVGAPDVWTQMPAEVTAHAFQNWQNQKTGAPVLVVAIGGSVYTVAGDPMTWADYSAEQRIADPGKIVTEMAVIQDMLIPLKENGLFSVSAIESAVNELPDLALSEDTFNGVGTATSNNHLLVPHKSGLLRWQPGQYRFVGPQQEGALEADITAGWGRVQHVSPFGKYAFLSANDTVNEMGSIWALEPPRGDRGPLVPHNFFYAEDGYYEGLTVVQDSADTHSFLVAIHVDSETGATVTPHVWQLPRSDYTPGSDPAIVKARTGASFFTPRYWQPGREVQKSWRCVEFYLEANPESGHAGLEVYAYIDNGSATQLLEEAGGAGANLQAGGFHRLFFPTTASGDFVQLEFRIPSGGINVAMTVRDVVLRMDLQPTMAEAVTTSLVLGGGEFEDNTTMRRTAQHQLADLKALQGRQDAATLIKDPWGNEFYGNVMVETYREVIFPGHTYSTLMADVVIRGRPYE